MSLRWRALYEDGSFLDQFQKDGSESKYTNIDRSKLRRFLLLDKEKPVVVVDIKPHQQLIYRRRVAVHIAIGPKGRSDTEVIYIVGWHENRNGKNIQMINFVFPDGHVEVLDRFQEDHRFYYPVILLKEEETK